MPVGFMAPYVCHPAGTTMNQVDRNPKESPVDLVAV
jgi:hypothetical protein